MPGAMPVTVVVGPLTGLTDAIEASLLDHMLTEIIILGSLKVIVPPTHTIESPTMGTSGGHANEAHEKNNADKIRTKCFIIVGILFIPKIGSFILFIGVKNIPESSGWSLKLNILYFINGSTNLRSYKKVLSVSVRRKARRYFLSCSDSLPIWAIFRSAFLVKFSGSP